MGRWLATTAGLLWLAGMGLASTYTVTTTADDGVGSLRWAIGRANAHAGADTITFGGAADGAILRPLAPLPAITDDGTTVDGDTNDNNTPDVGVDGSLIDPATYPEACGLTVRQADDCIIQGLVVTRWPYAGIWLEDCRRARVRTCHVGVNRGGTSAWPNRGLADIRLLNCSSCLIGAASSARRNVLAGGWYNAPDGRGAPAGIAIEGGARNKIRRNYIGIRRDGTAALGNGHEGATGVVVERGAAHQIGGTAADTGNVIGGLRIGAQIGALTRNTLVAGNLIGLAADGDTLAPVVLWCVYVHAGTTGTTTIGGTTAAARNVFAGGAQEGVSADKHMDHPVLIQGNYFGTNAAGTATRTLSTGVSAEPWNSSVTIGGSTAAAGNFFTPAAGRAGVGIRIEWGGRPVIRRNVFGMLPNGQDADGLLAGVYVSHGQPTIRGNEFANTGMGGVQIANDDSSAGVFGNRFHDCGAGVWTMQGASCRLGNLGNRASRDDGGNVFDPSNTWHIYNNTSNDIRAEGNDFGTNSYDDIAAKVRDQVDDASLGLVDFDPLMGGISPSGRTEAVASLAVTAASAAPTTAGADIAFTLSAPAAVAVDILNLAGRPVARLASGEPLAAGSHHTLWSRQTTTGLRAPAGRYMVRISARTPTGQAATGLCAILLP